MMVPNRRVGMKRAVAAARGISEKKTSNRTPPVWRKTATDFGEKAAKEQEGGGEKGANEEEKNFIMKDN